MPPHTAHASSCIAPRIEHAPLWATSRLGCLRVAQRLGIMCLWVAQRFKRCDKSPAPDVGFSPRGQDPRQLKEHSKTPAAPRKSGASAPRPAFQNYAGFSPRCSGRARLQSCHKSTILSGFSRYSKHSTRNPRHLSVPHGLTFACLWVAQRFQRCDKSSAPDVGFSPRGQAPRQLKPHPKTPAPPWKSGASAPRPASQNYRGFSPRIPFCERTMNSTCGKTTPHPRTKPVIAGDTTYGVSLLTGTISGSNFAIP